MITASDDRLPSLTWAAEIKPSADAGLFAFLDELRECEKRRDELLNRLSIEESGDQIEAVAKTACDAARAIYARIATIKPTTVAGVLRQLELLNKLTTPSKQCVTSKKAATPWPARSATAARASSTTAINAAWRTSSAFSALC